MTIEHTSLVIAVVIMVMAIASNFSYLVTASLYAVTTSSAASAAGAVGDATDPVTIPRAFCPV